MESTVRSSSGVRHYVTLDVCRVMAAVAIVWMHAWGYSKDQQIGEVGRFAVPFFAASAFFLMARGLMRDPHRPFGAYAVRRFDRIYLPFFAWSVIGLFVEDLHRIVAGRAIIEPEAFFLYFGSTMQLWFLPFLLGISLVLFLPLRQAVRWRKGAGMIAVVAGAVCALLPRVSLDPGQPATNWFGFVSLLQNSWNAMPSVFWGVGIAFLWGEKRSAALAWVGLVVFFASIVWVIHGPRNAMMENLAGAGLLIFCLNIGEMAGALGRYAFLAYGVYLSHAVILETIEGGVHHSSGMGATSMIFLATLAMSVACCLVLHRWVRTRWLLG